MAAISYRNYTQEDLQSAQIHLTSTKLKLYIQKRNYESHPTKTELYYYNQARGNYLRAIMAVQEISNAILQQQHRAFRRT